MQEKIKRIPPERYADISNTSYPRGMFYTDSVIGFIAIDNRDGVVVEKEFEGITGCIEWLRGRMG